MAHASRWHKDPRFYSPMTVLNGGIHVFVRDCVAVLHPVLGNITALITKFFTKVHYLVGN